jgi:DNA-binding MarR family transcriptional regulator
VKRSPRAAASAQTAAPVADFGWALTTVLRAYARAADRVVGGMPGGSRGFRLLHSIVHDEPDTQLALAREAGLDRTVVTYLLDDLAAAGLVERQACPGDRRTRRVVATEAGHATLRDLRERLRQVEDHLLETLGTAEAEQFRSLLERLAHEVRDADPAKCKHLAALAGDVFTTGQATAPAPGGQGGQGL